MKYLVASSLLLAISSSIHVEAAPKEPELRGTYWEEKDTGDIYLLDADGATSFYPWNPKGWEQDRSPEVKGGRLWRQAGNKVNFGFRLVHGDDAHSDYSFVCTINGDTMECNFTEKAWGSASNARLRGQDKGSKTLTRQYVVMTQYYRDVGGQPKYFYHYVNTLSYPVKVTLKNKRVDHPLSVVIPAARPSAVYPHREFDMGYEQPDGGDWDWNWARATPGEVTPP